MAAKPDVFDSKWDGLAFDGPRQAIIARMRERRDTFAAVAKTAGLNGTYLLQYFKKPSPRFLPLPVARRLAEILDLPVEHLYVEGAVPEAGGNGARQQDHRPAEADVRGPSPAMKVVSHVSFPDGEVIEIATNRKLTTTTVARLEAAVAMLKAGQR